MNETSSPDLGSAVHTGSTERFGYEWGRYAELKAVYEEQFRRWTPFFAPEDWQGKLFLDVGCGMGRNSHWPMSYGAAGGRAIDLDERSLASARRTLAGHPTVSVERCSAYELAECCRYDVAFSIGVIHHLEQPARALANMTRAVKPGGTVMIWVYGRENNGWIVTLLDPLRKALFSRLPIGLVHRLSWLPAAGLWLALRLGLSRLEYFRLIRRFDFAHLRSIVFDQMLPKIANYWRRDEVEALMRDAGLENVRLAWVNEISWAAIGTRPFGDTTGAAGPA
ncbi:class I SAM-dependent methyltransferase (plasmid) [Azospirillum sp. TSA2s]|uniref:class I SAM-dependent methyltransferase n=1 Tax=Azospirillum sp. TSA2s TaxID=709810 RepID=UPI0010AAF67A|nr:class I SAM-dependent methyltransferase [Azospirillum sp. TSA2s]QCG93031.1 class I SAM-dependent methyltransferase [Azospirillum sp. TSA2s]